MGGPNFVVFDWDGTIVDSQFLIHSVMSMALTAHGQPAPSLAAVRAVVGLELSEAIGRLLPTNFTEDLAAVVGAYRENFAIERAKPDCHEPLFDDVRTALTALEGLGILCGIATGKSQRGVRAGLAHHELDRFFVSVQTADDAPGKPHPGMLEQAMADVGARCEDTIMIGDTTFDMKMAANADVRALGVAWGYHGTDELKAAGAVSIVEQFADIPAVVNEMMGLDRAP